MRTPVLGTCAQDGDMLYVRTIIVQLLLPRADHVSSKPSTDAADGVGSTSGIGPAADAWRLAWRLAGP